MWYQFRTKAAALGGAVVRVLKNFWQPAHFARHHQLDQALVLAARGGKKLPNWRQWRYVRKFYSPQETLATQVAWFFLLLGLVALGVNIYQTRVRFVPAQGGEYVEAVVGTPNYINPLFSQANSVDQDLSKLIFSGLVKFDNTGKIIPDLADNFTIDPGQTTYTFTLKPNLAWHDNEPLTAEDVIFTIQSIKDRSFKSPLYSTFRNVEAKLIDKQTISLILPEPFAPFLSLLTVGILPAHLWQEIEPSHALLAELNLKPVGSGPYQFASFAKDKKGNILEYRLKRFDRYYAPGPFITNLTLKLFPTPEEALSALKNGNVDGYGLLAGSIDKSLAQDGNLKNYRLSLPQYTAVFFNQGANPALAEGAVRQALGLAASRDQIIKAAFADNAEPITDPLLPGSLSGADTLPTMLFDPARAEQILDNTAWKRVPLENASSTVANYQRAKKIINNKKEETAVLSVKLTTIQKEENIQAAETIRSLWQAIGVKVDLEIVDVGQIQKNIIKPRAYEALLFGQILGNDPDPYPFWHSSQINDPGLNLALYANKDADKLLEAGRRTNDAALRAKDYLEFEKKLRADLPAIFLYSLKFSHLMPAAVKGVAHQFIAQPADRFNDINQWYIKTKKSIKF